MTFGFSLMLTEIAIGRRTGKSVIGTYSAISRRFSPLCWLAALVPVIITPYYCVIGGWVLKYLFTYAAGQGSTAAGDGAFFKNQLADNTGEVPLYNPSSSSYYLQSEFSVLQDANLFVNAASLAEGNAYTTTTLRDHNLDTLEKAFAWLFRIRGTHVEETVYMPAHKSIEDRGD